jgi:hypothetical protein
MEAGISDHVWGVEEIIAVKKSLWHLMCFVAFRVFKQNSIQFLPGIPRFD